MLRAASSDKNLVVDILVRSFNQNRSINYIVRQDNRKQHRLRKLMEYSFEICHRFGIVYLTENKKGTALILFPHKKKSTILLDAELAFSVTGLSNLKKVMDRESAIKKLHPLLPFYYLWFIGVDPEEQHKGLGSDLMNQLLKDASINNQAVYLETSTITNIPWYEKFGFETYAKLDFGFELFCMKKG